MRGAIIGLIFTAVAMILFVLSQSINHNLGIFYNSNLTLLAEEAQPLISSVEGHKRTHGEYPGVLNDLDPKFKIDADNFGRWHEWHYTGFDDGYLLYRFTGHHRDTICYSNQEFNDRQFRWYIDDDSGGPHKLLDFKNRTK